MSEPKQAKVIAELSNPSDGALLGLQLLGHPDLVLRGGKYIIINTGRHNEEGKLIKRAYSLFAVQAQAQQFFLAAEPVEQGIASQYLRELKTGETITFSGPWGRFHWPDAASEKLLIAAAFGSGITGILGYLASVPDDCSVQIFWYQDEAKHFLPANLLLECVGGANRSLQFRGRQADPTVDLDQKTFTEARFIAAGDGQGVDRFLSFLGEHGIAEDRLQSEVFYRQRLS